MYEGNFIIVISIALATIAFLILVVFLVMTLLALIKSLKKTEKLVEQSNDIARNVNEKLHVLDPLFNGVRRVNRIVEKQIEEPLHFAEEVEERCEHKREERVEVAASILEFVEWGLVGLALVMKARKKGV